MCLLSSDLCLGDRQSCCRQAGQKVFFLPAISLLLLALSDQNQPCINKVGAYSNILFHIKEKINFLVIGGSIVHILMLMKY